VTGSTLANVNQSSSAQVPVSGSGRIIDNSLNQLYSTSQLSLYPHSLQPRLLNTPLPVRFTNVDQILAAAGK